METGSHCEVQADLESTAMLLAQPLEGWDYNVGIYYAKPEFYYILKSINSFSTDNISMFLSPSVLSDMKSSVLPPNMEEPTLYIPVEAQLL